LKAPKSNQVQEAMAGDGTKSIIVTFKRKDKRPDKKTDKTELVRAAIERRVTLF
jgi:hypothetical protein